MKKIVPLLLVILTLATSLQGADPTIEALETLRRGFAGTEDFTAEVTQEKQLSVMKQKLVSKGVVRFRKPDTFFMELFSPHPSRLLLKDNLMSLRLIEQGITDKVTLPPEEGLKKWLIALDKPVTKVPEGVDAKATRRGKNWVLQIFPKSKGSVRDLSLTFDMGGRISKIAINERNNDQTTLYFTKMRRNVGLKDSDFRVE